MEGSEVVIVKHDGVKRRLGDVRYVPKLQRNLFSLGRLESKVCTFKASEGLLKVIKGSMVLMRGRRSERNLYVLQVESGSLGHIDNGCKTPKKVIFDEGYYQWYPCTIAKYQWYPCTIAKYQWYPS